MIGMIKKLFLVVHKRNAFLGYSGLMYVHDADSHNFLFKMIFFIYGSEQVRRLLQ
jgi:hypothetical protein